MRNLIIRLLLIGTVILNPILSQAETNCEEVLSKADLVINKQDKLILILQKKSDELTDENAQLNKAVLELKDMSDSQFSKDLAYGLGGVVLGILIYSLTIK